MQWRNWFGPFRGSLHEPHWTSSPSASTGAPLLSRRRFYMRSTRPLKLKLLPTNRAQLPQLSRRRSPRAEIHRATAPRAPPPWLDVPPAIPSTATCHLLLYLPALRTEQLPQLARLIRREDIPRRPHRLARPLIAQQDQLLQQEFLKRNDLGGNVFLLIRHTGMRIGECADLSFDCLRATGPNQWAILVPLGKLKTERMVPVDSSVVTVIQRLRFYRSLDPQRPDGRLLARRSSRDALIRQLRNYLHRVCHSLEISARIVPHQFRHTYATEMLRAGVSLPSVMKLLGHASLNMTMIYVEVVMDDLQREFQQARSKPRHLVPQPKTSVAPIRTGLDGVIDSLHVTQHALEMFRRALPIGAARNCLDRLSNRLTKIITEARKLRTP
jgi:integrase